MLFLRFGRLSPDAQKDSQLLPLKTKTSLPSNQILTNKKWATSTVAHFYI